MQLSINKRLINKPDDKMKPPDWNKAFKAKEVTRQELADNIKQGFAFAPQFEGERNKDNFKVAGCVALDFDKGWTVEQALQESFIATHAAILYTTPSHMKGEQERFRVIFELEQPITDRFQYEQLLATLLKRYPMADQSCKDAARFYYGSQGCELHLMQGVLSQAVVNQLLNEFVPVSQSSNNPSLTVVPKEEVAKMLSVIPPDVDYHIWRNICFGIANTFGQEGKALIEAWSPDDKQKGRHLNELFARSDGRVTLGTVIFHASQNGYRLPPHCSPQKRSPGQVVMEDLFQNGYEWVCIANDLYHYEDGYYQKKADEALKSKIAHYFNTYCTNDKGDTAFATPHQVKSALEFTKQSLYYNQEGINPPGWNLGNGYLKLEHRSRQPHFELIEHSSENVFTYKADFSYKPEVGSQVFQDVLSTILEKDYAEIFIRVLAASFNLTEVRKAQGRSIRCLFLYGEGSNGKDTLKEWAYQLYGKQGLTSIPLRAFKQADQGRLFGLMSLVVSRINWPSENEPLALDHCQYLKNCITGDTLMLEEKYKPPFELKPKTVFLANINQLPYVQNPQEAIESRYAIIPFNKTFKRDPNPDNPNEQLADPRLKENEDYIREVILPSMLNCLIDAYPIVLAEGVDYSCNQAYFQEVVERSNHLAIFIKDYGVKYCGFEEGISPSQFLLEYTAWARMEGFINDSEEGRPVLQHPHPTFDKLIQTPAVLTKRLKELMPKLETGKVKGHRHLNVRITKEGVPF